MNLTDAISTNALAHPRRLAIQQGEIAITYAELDAWINQIAARLIAHGAKVGEPIGICLHDRPVHLAGMFAVLRIGCIVLPMDWRWTVAEQTRIAQRYKPTFVLVEPTRPCSAEVNTIAVDQTWEISSLATMAGLSTTSISHQDGSNLPAMLGLSSGTTGEPKAVVTTHAQYRARIDGFMTNCRLSADDRYCSALPLAFSAGRLFAMLNLVAGATVILVPTMSSPAEIAQIINDSGSTTTCLVPTVSRAMLQLSDGTDPLLPGLRVLMSIGAPLHAADRIAIRRRISPNLVDIYACTGGSLATVIWPDEQDRHPDSVGQPARGVVLEIVNENDIALPAGETGRVRYRGPGMPLGLFQTDAIDDDLRDGWCYPGDFASINSEGYVFLKGRRSEIVIRGGINIYTPEIERALLSHPLVIEAAVIGVPEKDADEQVIAFVRSRTPLDSQTLLAHCRTLLAAYKIPARFHIVDALPKNSAGKVLKRELKKRIAEASTQ